MQGAEKLGAKVSPIGSTDANMRSSIGGGGGRSSMAGGKHDPYALDFS